MAGAGTPLLPALALLAVLAFLVAACGGAGSASQDPVATSTVDLPKSYKFEPAAITVPAGTTVTWTNHDAFTHTVKVGDADPLRMAPGEAATWTFATAGTFSYLCTLHPQNMQGTVVVTAT